MREGSLSYVGRGWDKKFFAHPMAHPLYKCVQIFGHCHWNFLKHTVDICRRRKDMILGLFCSYYTLVRAVDKKIIFIVTL